MNKSIEEINDYLDEVKTAVKNGRCRIERNKKRQANLALFRDYVIDERKCMEIILGLSADNFSGILQNEHTGYEQEQLYVFGTEVRLLQRFGESVETVPLYIKLNKLKESFVIVVSFHRQARTLHYAFR